MVLQSNITNEEKESILMEFLQSKDESLQSKERDVQYLERVVRSKDGLLEALKRETQSIRAERDFLKGTLDARHIFENYEARFKIQEDISGGDPSETKPPSV
jgi:hypothetical protein